MTTDLTTTQPQALGEGLAQLVAEWLEHERRGKLRLAYVG